MRMIVAMLTVLFALPITAAPASTQTLRVDLQHGGDAASEHCALERVVVEALPWAGNPD